MLEIGLGGRELLACTLACPLDTGQGLEYLGQALIALYGLGRDVRAPSPYIMWSFVESRSAEASVSNSGSLPLCPLCPFHPSSPLLAMISNSICYRAFPRVVSWANGWDVGVTDQAIGLVNMR